MEVIMGPATHYLIGSPPVGRPVPPGPHVQPQPRMLMIYLDRTVSEGRAGEVAFVLLLLWGHPLRCLTHP
jgi:hypothetical protein